MAFNDAVAIIHPLPGDLRIEGTIDGRKLCALLSKLESDDVDVLDEDGKVKVRAGRTRASFDVLPVELPYGSVDMSGELVDLPDGFVDQLDWVSSSCSKSTSRPALNCVVVENGTMQASDGYRVSRVDSISPELPRLMIQLPQVSVLTRGYKLRRVALSDRGEWARFETEDGTTLCARSMSGAFPDLSKEYEVEGSEIRLSTALRATIDRARIFSSAADSDDEEIRLSLRPNQVTVSARCDGASFSETVKCDGVTSEVGFTIYPKLLSKALESGTSCVVGPRSVLFRGKDWKHVVALKIQ